MVPDYAIQEYKSMEFIISIQKKVIKGELDAVTKGLADKFNEEQLKYWVNKLEMMKLKYPGIELVQK